MALIGSVLYDWAYLTRLGLSFADVPTSLADHGRSALLWLPTLAVATAAAFVVELFTRRTEHGMTESEIIATAPNPERVRRFRRSGEIAMFGGALLFPIPSYLLLGDGFRSGLSLSATALWVIFVRWVYGHPRRQSLITPLGLRTMVWGGIFIIAAFFAGDFAGGAALTSQPISHTLSMNQSSGDIEVTVFRPFEKGALIRPVNDARFRFIFWSEVKSVTVAYKATTRFRGLLCYFWPASCQNPSPSSIRGKSRL